MNKMIYGNVNRDGTKETGYDFLVQRLKKGIYEIKFSVPFSTVPTLLVTQNYRKWDDFDSEKGDPRSNAMIIAVSESKAKIKTGDGNGKVADRNFSFLAICEIPT